jgi:hypothetical protein
MRALLSFSKLGALAVGLLVMGLAGSAFAQYYYPPPPPPPGYYAPRPPPPPPGYYYGRPGPPPYLRRPPPPPPKFLTLTFQPLMLIPMEQPQEFFELSAEFKAARWLGLDALGGVGSYEDNVVGGTNYELGGEVNFYVAGGFRRGVMLAPFVRYFGASEGNSLEWGGLVGYKWTSWAGFTWLIQAGVGVIDTLSMRDSSNDFGDGTVPNDVTLPWAGDYLYNPGSVSVVGLVRLGIGWSI